MRNPDRFFCGREWSENAITMSHSVFKDFDEDAGKNSDANLIVFINKDGDVTVDQSALKEYVGMLTFFFFAIIYIPYKSFYCLINFKSIVRIFIHTYIYKYYS